MREKTSESIKKINLEHVKGFGYVYETDKIVCPYCGEEWEMDYDDYENSPYEKYEEQCIECEEDFLLDCEPHTTFVFTSYKLNKEVAE